MSSKYLSLLTLLLALPAAAQQPNPLAAADSALRACAEAAEREDEDTAKPAADRAIKLYRALQNTPTTAADALTGEARVIGQCRIPFVSMMRKGALSEESIELSQRALQIDSMHFGARMTVAMNFYNTPAFLGKTDDAVRELEWLVRVYGPKKIPPMAEVYAYLGDLYTRQDRHTDAKAIWQRGITDFPDAELLKSRLVAKKETPQLPSTQAPQLPSAQATPPLQAFTLKPLVVEAGSYSVEDPRTATALKRLDVYTAPGGAADMLQVFQMMPGATRATDGSDLYVRGGDPSESPVFVDGARLFHPGTFEALDGSVFGVLDPSVLKTAYFSAGGFSARYGNALSGVLDVETEGRPDVFRWRAGANLATAGATVYAPLSSKSGAFVATSATETSALLHMHGRADEYTSSPRAGQALASYVYAPREGTYVRLVGLTEADKSEAFVRANNYAGPFQATGATRLLGLNGRWLSTDAKNNVRGSIALSQRATGFTYGVLDRDRDDQSISARFEAERSPNARVRLRAGGEIARLTMNEEGIVPETWDLRPDAPARTLDAAERTTSHVGGFAEGEYRVLPAVAFVAGVRADRLPGEEGVTIDPRLGVAVTTGDWTLRAGGGVYHQGRWRVKYNVPDAGRPQGIPTRATHLAIGAQRDGDTPIRVEAFAKHYGDYVVDGEGRQITSGRSLGIDALIRYTAFDRVSGWVSYSLLDAAVDLQDGTRVRANNDVTHTFTGVAKTSISDAWEIGTTLRYGTGKPVTPILSAREVSAAYYEPVRGPLNSDRLPEYVRLDARLMHLKPIGSRLLVFYLEGLNVLNQHNVLAYSYDQTYRIRHGVRSFFSDRTFVMGVEAQF